MISFSTETDFNLSNSETISKWISQLILSEGYKEGEITYVFCDDAYLHKLNVAYLDHDTLTDILTFDYSVGKELHSDIVISVERVKDNAIDFNTTFENELHRVMAHGVLHLCGYKDKDDNDKQVMREKEDFYLKCLSEYS